MFGKDFTKDFASSSLMTKAEASQKISTGSMAVCLLVLLFLLKPSISQADVAAFGVPTPADYPGDSDSDAQDTFDSSATTTAQGNIHSTRTTMLQGTSTSTVIASSTIVTEGNTTSLPATTPQSNATSQTSTTPQQGNTTSDPAIIPQQSNTTSQPSTTSQQGDTTSQPSTTPQQGDTTSQSSTTPQQGDTTSQPSTTPQQGDTTSQPSTTAQQGDTTLPPTATPQQSNTTSQPSTTPQQSNTTSQPSTTSQQGDTTSQPSTTQQQGNNTSQPSTTSQQGDTTLPPTATPQQSNTTSQPSTTPQQSNTTSQPSTTSQQGDTTSQTSTTPQQSNTTSQPSTTPQQGETTSQPSTTPQQGDTTSQTSTTPQQGDTTSQTSTTSQQGDTTSQTSTTPQQGDTTSQTSTTPQQGDTTSQTSTTPQQSSTTSQTSTTSQQGDTTSQPSTTPQQSNTTSQPSTTPQQSNTTSQTSTTPQQGDTTSQTSTTPQQGDTTSQPSTTPQQGDTTSQPSTTPQQGDTTSQTSTTPQQGDTTSQPSTTPQQSNTTSQTSTTPQQGDTTLPPTTTTEGKATLSPTTNFTESPTRSDSGSGTTANENYAEGSIRLVNGVNQYEGRVEIWYKLGWRRVCGDGWRLNEAKVVCRQLGFSDATEYFNSAAFGPGIGTTFLMKVQCVGTESGLLKCSGGEFKDNLCGQSSDAGVRCKQPEVATQFLSLGCYNDASTRALREYSPYTTNDSKELIQRCADIAACKGYRIFSIQYYSQCFTDEDAANRYSMYGAGTGCDPDGIGGFWVQNVYILTALYINVTVEIMDKTFSVPLLNKSSPEYLSLQSSVRSETERVMAKVDNKSSIQAIRLRPGNFSKGVVVDVSMRNINSTTTFLDVKNVMLPFLTNQSNLNPNYNRVRAFCGQCRPPFVYPTALQIPPYKFKELSTDVSHPSELPCSEKHFFWSRVYSYGCAYKGYNYNWQIWPLDPKSSEVIGNRVVLSDQLTSSPDYLLHTWEHSLGLYMLRRGVKLKGVRGTRRFAYSFLKIVEGVPEISFKSDHLSNQIQPAKNVFIQIKAGLSIPTTNNCPFNQNFNGTFGEMTFIWSCWRQNETYDYYYENIPSEKIQVTDGADYNGKDLGGCFGTGQGRLGSTTDEYRLDTYKLLPEQVIYIGVRVMWSSTVVNIAYTNYTVLKPATTIVYEETSTVEATSHVMMSTSASYDLTITPSPSYSERNTQLLSTLTLPSSTIGKTTTMEESAHETITTLLLSESPSSSLSLSTQASSSLSSTSITTTVELLPLSSPASSSLTSILSTLSPTPSSLPPSSALFPQETSSLLSMIESSSVISSSPIPSSSFSSQSSPSPPFPEFSSLEILSPSPSFSSLSSLSSSSPELLSFLPSSSLQFPDLSSPSFSSSSSEISPSQSFSSLQSSSSSSLFPSSTPPSSSTLSPSSYLASTSSQLPPPLSSSLDVISPSASEDIFPSPTSTTVNAPSSAVSPGIFYRDRFDVIFKVISENFTSDLYNESSSAFQRMRTKLIKSINQVCCQGNITQIAFRPGCVIVTASMDLIATGNFSIRDSLKTAIVDYGEFGHFRTSRTFKLQFSSWSAGNSKCKRTTIRILGQSQNVSRSKSRKFEGHVTIHCPAGRYTRLLYQWSVREIDDSGTITCNEKVVKNSSNHWHWAMPVRFLPVGYYLVEFSATTEGPRNETVASAVFINIVPSDLEATVAGGSLVTWGRDNNNTLNASNSYDPDVGPGNHTGMAFIWLCRVAGENWTSENLESHPNISYNPSGGSGCFESGIGRLQTSGHDTTLLTIRGGVLRANRIYEFCVLVVKGNRRAPYCQRVSVIPGNPVTASIACKTCKNNKVNPSTKVTFTVTCEMCGQDTSYHWALHEKKKDNSYQHKPLEGIVNSVLDGPSIVIRANAHALDAGVTYQIIVNITSPGYSQGTYALEFCTNVPPTGGVCTISPDTGTELDTMFKIACTGWIDKETPLYYKLSYKKMDGTNAVISSQENTLSLQLPRGNSSLNYSYSIKVIISDSLGAANPTSLTVQVRPLSANTSLANTLANLTTGQNSAMALAIQVGDVQAALQIAIVVVSTLDNIATTDSNATISTADILQINVVIMETVSNITVDDSPSTLNLVTSVAASITSFPNLPASTQQQALAIFQRHTTLLVRPDSEDEDTLLAAENIIHGCGNVLSASSSEAKYEGQTSDASNDTAKQESKARALQADLIINQVSIILLVSKAPGEEPSVIRVTTLTVVVKKDLSCKLSGQQFSEGDSNVQLPQSSLFGSQDSCKIAVDIVYRVTNVNPYTWDSSSGLVDSSVVSLSLQVGIQPLPVNNVTDPITITIATAPAPATPPRHTFLTPGGSAQKRQLYCSVAGSAFTITVTGTAPLTLYFNRNRNVSPEQYSYMVRIRLSPSANTESVFLPAEFCPLKEIYYFIALLADALPVQSRRRRDCSVGHGRQKRSCVDVKDAPTTPPPKNLTIVPVYNPKTDVNVSIGIKQASCLYWSDTKQIWTSEGCQAGNKSTATSIVCKCTHLTSFGGNFLVPPNPIDFDVVILAFKNLGESKNYSVIATVGTSILVYLIVVLLARRADKKDIAKTGPHLTISRQDTATATYEITIATDIWRGSGTTANVAMILCGDEITSDVIIIRHNDFPNRTLFGRGNVDRFIVHLPTSLGNLLCVRIWHDNSGSNPSWLLRSVTVRDINGNDRWALACNRWLAVDQDNGELECTLTSQEGPTNFSSSFTDKTANDFADNHLWISVIARSPCNYFSRVQRATCCLSLFMSAMVVNAMFYNFGGKSEDVFRLGPLQFSLRQIVVGIQSGLIVAPVNILIVQLFRLASKLEVKYYEKHTNDVNVSRLQKLSDQYKSVNFSFEYETLSSKPKRKLCRITRHGLVRFLAFFLTFAVTAVSGAFTIFYSMMWGNDLSVQWLSSMLVSFVQDIFVLQPIKIFIVAIMVSLLLRKFNRSKTEPGRETTPSSADIKLSAEGPASRYLVSDNNECAPLSEAEKQVARGRRETEKSAATKTKEIILYVVFLILLSVVCYGNRTHHGYYLTTAIKQGIPKYTQITTDDRLIKWLNTSLLSGLYAGPWYNSKPVSNTEYIGDKKSILLGMPRMKQSRVEKGHCIIPEAIRSIVQSCVASYSMGREDKTLVNLPAWKPITLATNNMTTQNAALTPENCPKPWRYHFSNALGNLPYWGMVETYSGGGYVANLGYTTNIARRVINDLVKENWFDRRSRALLVVFAVFNANTDYISIVSFLFEDLPTGAGISSQKISSMPLYNIGSFYLVFQLLFLVFVLVYLVLICIRVYNMKMAFFADVWNWVEILLIVVSIMVAVIQLIKGIYTSSIVRQIQNNPFGDFSFDHIVLATELEDSAMSLLVFFSTMKLLKLILLHVRVVMISAAMKVSFKRLMPFALIFVVILLAYAQLGILVFGTTETDYATLYRTLSMELLMFIGGDTHINKLREANRILAPFYIISFIFFMAFVLMNVFIAILSEAQFQQKNSLNSLSNDVKVIDFMEKKMRSFLKLPPKTSADYSDTFVSNFESKRTRYRERKRAVCIPEVQVDNTFDDIDNYKQNELKETFESASNNNSLLESFDKLKRKTPSKETSLNVSFNEESDASERRKRNDGQRRHRNISKEGAVRRQLAGTMARIIKRQANSDHVTTVHEKMRRVSMLLEMMEMDETGDDIKLTQFFVRRQSEVGSVTNPASIMECDDEGFDFNSVDRLFHSSAQMSAVTLSNVGFGASLENEEEIKMVFPRPQASVDKRFRPVAMGTQAGIRMTKGSAEGGKGQGIARPLRMRGSNSSLGSPVPESISRSMLGIPRTGIISKINMPGAGRKVSWTPGKPKKSKK